MSVSALSPIANTALIYSVLSNFAQKFKYPRSVSMSVSSLASNIRTFRGILSALKCARCLTMSVDVERVKNSDRAKHVCCYSDFKMHIPRLYVLYFESNPQNQKQHALYFHVCSSLPSNTLNTFLPFVHSKDVQGSSCLQLQREIKRRNYSQYVCFCFDFKHQHQHHMFCAPKMKTMNTPCLCWVRENKHRLRNSSTHI
jgi:hypothetical protein